MSSTSTRFGMTLADGTDGFDNDKFIKQPLQALDAGAAKVAETITILGGLKAEIIEVSFACSGATNVVTATASYSGTYATNPMVMPMNVTQTVSYSDTMKYPFFSGYSRTGCTIKLQVASTNVGDNFGSGTLKMKFLVIGS